MKKLSLVLVFCMAAMLAEARIKWGSVSDYSKKVFPSGSVSISFRCVSAFDWCYQTRHDGTWVINYQEGVVVNNEPEYDPVEDLYTAEVIEE